MQPLLQLVPPLLWGRGRGTGKGRGFQHSCLQQVSWELQTGGASRHVQSPSMQMDTHEGVQGPRGHLWRLAPDLPGPAVCHDTEVIIGKAGPGVDAFPDRCLSFLSRKASLS